MKILITGSTGLLGQALAKRLALGSEIIGLSRHDAQVPGESAHVVCDLADAQAIQRVVRDATPDVVVHTQAMSDVDRCELEPELAYKMNVDTVEHVCHVAHERTIPVIMISTNCVFDGEKASPYDESDEPRPINVYGRTKLAGERLALRYPQGYVIRSSLLFGAGARRANFCETVVQVVQQGQPIEAFVDQAVSPTYADDFSEGLVQLIHALRQATAHKAPRLYHLVNSGTCSRVELASRIVDLMRGSRTLVKPVHMADQGRPAKRPANATLTSRLLPAAIGRSLRPWDEALQAYLTQRRLIN